MSIHTTFLLCKESRSCPQCQLPPNPRMPPSNNNRQHILAGISPPTVRRHVTSMRERQRQVEDERHPLFNQVLAVAANRMRSRKSFLNSVDPLSSSSKGTRISMWEERLPSFPPEIKMALNPKEELPPGSDTKWTEWKCLIPP